MVLSWKSLASSKKKEVGSSSRRRIRKNETCQHGYVLNDSVIYLFLHQICHVLHIDLPWHASSCFIFAYDIIFADTFVSERPDSARMKTYAQLSLGISAFFWIWAAKNTYEMEQGLDLGIVSFFTVMISSIMLLLKKSDDPNLKIHRFAAVGSHVFVSLNYLLGYVLFYFVLFFYLCQPVCLVR